MAKEVTDTFMVAPTKGIKWLSRKHKKTKDHWLMIAKLKLLRNLTIQTLLNS